MNRPPPLLVLVLLAGCATTETKGKLLRTERGPDDCAKSELQGVLGAVEAGQLAVGVTEQCQVRETDVFRVERTSSPAVLPTVLISLGAFGVVTGALLSWLITQPPNSAVNALGSTNTGLLFLIPGVVVGAVVAATMAALKISLEDGEVTMPRPPAPAIRPVADGALHGVDEERVSWPIHDGRASVPLDEVLKLDLTRLTVGGKIVQLDKDSLSRADGLSSCRQALAPSAPASGDCAARSRRWNGALRCSEAGWSFAREVEVSLRAAVHDCPAQ